MTCTPLALPARVRPKIAMLACGIVIGGACLPACASVIDLDALHRTSPADASDAGLPTGLNATSDSGPAPSSDAGDPTCGQHPGPAMTRLNPPGTSFCVDVTEVTNEDYAAFLAAGSPASTLDACSDSGDPRPKGNWPAAPGAGAQPVTSVTWCDAASYCAWAGKELCGATGGGPLDPSSNNPASAWFTACGASVFADGAPNGEWEDSCNDDGDNGSCSVRGASCGTRRFVSRSNAEADVGFRCCGS